MLLQHQQRIMMRNNLPNVLDQLVSESDDKFELEHNTIDNSFFDIVNHDVQQKKGVDRMFIMQKMEETRGKVFTILHIRSVLQRVYYIKLYFFLVIFDEYTQKEHQKSNNKAANNLKNFVVETENGPIELATALRYERMRANTNLIRTKGRISR